jgi:circadian clock protein KaiC
VKARATRRKAASNSRVSTGVAGLDTITRGGLLGGGIYIVAGKPGAGKTILSNQIAFHTAREGGRVVYATLLAETHARLLQQIRPLSFFEDRFVGREITYLNALDAVVEKGLAGLLDLLRRMVRDQRASLLVVDGMVTAAQLAGSDVEYRTFIRELQTWVSVVDCTVLLVTSGGLGVDGAPEHTMVDGIIELLAERVRMRQLRHITIPKFRGGGVVEGQHSYVIGDSGLRIFPRIEAEENPDGATDGRPRPTGIPGLDPLVGGGWMPGSTTLLLGSSGAGKTIFGMQSLASALEKGERALHYSFYESPSALRAKAKRLHLPYEKHVKRGALEIRWQKPAEPLLDSVVYDLLETLDRVKPQRLFIDGFVGFRTTAYSDRVSTVFSAFAEEVSRRQVTTLISDETRELYIQDIVVPTENVSAIFHNIVFMRQVEEQTGDVSALRHALWVMKTRDTAHDHRGFAVDVTSRGLVVTGPLERARPDDPAGPPRHVLLQRKVH